MVCDRRAGDHLTRACQPHPWKAAQAPSPARKLEEIQEGGPRPHAEACLGVAPSLGGWLLTQTNSSLAWVPLSRVFSVLKGNFLHPTASTSRVSVHRKLVSCDTERLLSKEQPLCARVQTN